MITIKLPQIGLASVILILVLFACDDATMGSARIAHPTPENIPDEAKKIARHWEGTRSVDESLRNFAIRLAGAEKAFTIGALRGERYKVFGLIEDIGVDHKGRFYVLDSRLNEVRIFGRQGRFLQSFGAPGPGPREFQNPEGIEVEPQGVVAVLDAGLPGVKFFKRADSTFVRTLTVRPKLGPEGFCVLDDRIYMRAWRPQNDKMIHVFARSSGEYIDSFGGAYVAGNWLVKEQLSAGLLACDQDAQMIVTMFDRFPIIRGYSPDGRLKWTSVLADWRQQEIESYTTPDGRPGISYSAAQEYSTAEALADAPGKYVVIQVARHDSASIADRREWKELHTYVISSQSGKGVYIGHSLPRIGAMSRAWIYAASNTPFPQVYIFQYR